MMALRSRAREYIVPGLGFVGAVGVFGLALWNPPWISQRAVALEAATLVVLAIITAVYAFHTHQIGKRTAAMVDEARRARQDAYRPFLDIRGKPQDIENIKLGLAQRTEPDAVPEYVSCEVKNVGNGPAFAVQLFVNFDESSVGSRRVLGEPTLMPGYEIVDLGGPRPGDVGRISVVGQSWSPLRLRVEPIDDDSGKRVGVHVEYRDVFGRRFASRKPFVSGSHDFLGALEIVEMEPESVDSEGTGERR